MQIGIEAQLSSHVFPFMLTFTRLGAGFMMFPGIGESFVSTRIRMMFVLAVTFLIYPVLAPQMPPIPPQPADLVKIIAIEALVGIFFSSIMRLLTDILEGAGAIIGMDIGLSNAMILNPSLATQSALPAALLGTAGVALVFLTGLDEMLFRALLDTYKIFPVGMALPIGEMTHSFIELMARCFATAVQLASPFMIMGLLVYSVIGIVQKMMQQIQLFMIVLPGQIWGGLFLFGICSSLILGLWLQTFDDVVSTFFIRQ